MDIKTLSIFFIIILIISFVLLILNVIGSVKKSYLDKSSPFECGFSNFVQTRERIAVQFYRVGLLFLIFDLELILVYPYLVSGSGFINFSISTFILIIFIFILTLGFIYELGKGALNITSVSIKNKDNK